MRFDLRTDESAVLYSKVLFSVNQNFQYPSLHMLRPSSRGPSVIARPNPTMPLVEVSNTNLLEAP